VPVWTTWRSKDSSFYRDSNSDPSVFQPVASRYIDCAIVTVIFTLSVTQMHIQNLHIGWYTEFHQCVLYFRPLMLLWIAVGNAHHKPTSQIIAAIRDNKGQSNITNPTRIVRTWRQILDLRHVTWSTVWPISKLFLQSNENLNFLFATLCMNCRKFYLLMWVYDNKSLRFSETPHVTASQEYIAERMFCPS
jgi:hypothetical protein